MKDDPFILFVCQSERRAMYHFLYPSVAFTVAPAMA
jgi:hypothetical protein